MKGDKVTIREILEEEHVEKASYFTLKLNETNEKVHIGVKPESAHMVKTNAKLFCAHEKKDVIGYTK